jgi:hypothetical protein
MKVFASLFSKSDRGRGRAALGARRNGRNDLGVSFGYFLCASGVKEKNGIK